MKRPPKLIQFVVLAGAVLLLAGFVVYRTQFVKQDKPQALELNVAKGVRGQSADQEQKDVGEAHKADMHLGGSKSLAPFTERDTTTFIGGSKDAPVFTERDLSKPATPPAPSSPASPKQPSEKTPS